MNINKLILTINFNGLSAEICSNWCCHKIKTLNGTKKVLQSEKAVCMRECMWCVCVWVYLECDYV